MIRVAAIALVALSAGCGRVSPYYCDGDEECVIGNRNGVCTIYQFCAFDDVACGFDLRYHESAGPLAGICVGEEPFPPSGECGPEYCGDDIDGDCFDDPDPTCPPGDDPDEPQPLLDWQWINLRYANNDYTPSCASPGGRDMFFETVIEQPSLMFLDTWGTDFRAILVVRAGACADIDTSEPEISCVEYACSEYHQQWAGYLDPGTYCVIVDQYDEDEAAFGSWNLILRRSLGPPVSGGYPGDLYAETCSRDDWFGSCSPGAPDASWMISTCTATTLRLSTCDTQPEFTGTVQAYSHWFEELGCAAGCPGLDVELTEPGAVWLVAEAADAGSCGDVVVRTSY